MTYKIKVNVTEAVRDFYPGLSYDQIQEISEKIVSNWDYSYIYDEIMDEIENYATFLKIDLEDKDGVTTDDSTTNGVDNVYAFHYPSKL